ncbi:MAG: UrcA family protein [Pseudomonadota bacterium]
MFRISSLIAAACALSAAASAKENVVTFQTEIFVEAELMESPEGAFATLQSIESQARKACRISSVASRTPRTDKVCVNDVVHQAVSKIDNVMLSAAYEASPRYQVAPVRPARLADAG